MLALPFNPLLMSLFTASFIKPGFHISAPVATIAAVVIAMVATTIDEIEKFPSQQ